MNGGNQEDFSYHRFNLLGKKSELNYYKAITHWWRSYVTMCDVSTRNSDKKGAAGTLPNDHHWSKRRLGILGWWQEDFEGYNDVQRQQQGNVEDVLSTSQEFWVNMLEKNKNFINALLSTYTLTVVIRLISMSYRRLMVPQDITYQDDGNRWVDSMFTSEDRFSLNTKGVRSDLVTLIVLVVLIGTVAEFNGSVFNYLRMKHALRNYKMMGDMILWLKLLELTVQIFYFTAEEKTKICEETDYTEDIVLTYRLILKKVFELASTSHTFVLATIPMPNHWYCPSLCLMAGISFMFHGFTCLVAIPMVQRLFVCISVLMPTATAFTAIVFIDSEMNAFHLSRSIDYIERNKKQRRTLLVKSSADSSCKANTSHKKKRVGKAFPHMP